MGNSDTKVTRRLLSYDDFCEYFVLRSTRTIIREEPTWTMFGHHQELGRYVAKRLGAPGGPVIVISRR
jgi:hypothetical protein